MHSYDDTVAATLLFLSVTGPNIFTKPCLPPFKLNDLYHSFNAEESWIVTNDNDIISNDIIRIRFSAYLPGEVEV